MVHKVYICTYCTDRLYFSGLFYTPLFTIATAVVAIGAFCSFECFIIINVECSTSVVKTAHPSISGSLLPVSVECSVICICVFNGCNRYLSSAFFNSPLYKQKRKMVTRIFHVNCCMELIVIHVHCLTIAWGYLHAERN